MLGSKGKVAEALFTVSWISKSYIFRKYINQKSNLVLKY